MLIDLVLGYVVGMPVFDIVTDTDCVYDDEEDGDNGDNGDYGDDDANLDDTVSHDSFNDAEYDSFNEEVVFDGDLESGTEDSDLEPDCSSELVIFSI